VHEKQLNDGFGDNLSVAEWIYVTGQGWVESPGQAPLVEAAPTCYEPGRGWINSVDHTEMLITKDRLLQIMVAERHLPPADYDDALQEARITLWTVISRNPDVSAAYLHRSAARRIDECRDRQTWTGHTRTHGQPTDPLRQRDKESLDDPERSIEATAPDVLDAILLAYHEGEIVRALNLLPAKHREYIVLRFWGGLTHTEIAARQGLSKQHVQRIWQTQIRPRLAQTLAHLAPL
jgi:RNA polymerase sigma factor (sigma-70 family)